MEQPSLFTPEESEAVKSSWNILTENGKAPVGQLVLYRFFNDVPEVRTLFYNIGVDDDIPQSYSLESLKKNQKFAGHAKRVALTIDLVVRNLDNTQLIVEKCVELGKAHIKHKVKPHYFDLLGEVLANVIAEAMGLDLAHPTMQAWIKAYGAVAGAAKQGLRSVD